MRPVTDIIISYLDGTASGADKAVLAVWLEESEANRADFIRMRDLWLLSSAGEDGSAHDPDTDRALGRLMTAIDGRRRRGVMRLGRKALGIAASVALLFATGYTCYRLGAGSVHDAEPVTISRLITGAGSKGRFVLPDSTVVWLNAGSTLTYPDEFGTAARRVTLTGEAYFEVKHDRTRPFTVSAPELEVTVLGTHFSVADYPGCNRAEAVLVEGSVEVSAPGMARPQRLRPGQMISVDKGAGSASLSEVRTSNYTSWIKDKVTFDNESLGDIAVNLSRRFVTEIECDPAVARSVRVTLSVRNGEELDDILASMALVAPIRYERSGGTLRILPR